MNKFARKSCQLAPNINWIIITSSHRIIKSYYFDRKIWKIFFFKLTKVVCNGWLVESNELMADEACDSSFAKLLAFANLIPNDELVVNILLSPMLKSKNGLRLTGTVSWIVEGEILEKCEVKKNYYEICGKLLFEVILAGNRRLNMILMLGWV